MTFRTPTESDTRDQHPLKLSSHIWVMIGVVIGIAVWGDWEYRLNAPADQSSEHAFGGWRAPVIVPLSANSTIELSPELEMEWLEGFRYYRARFPGDRSDGTITFVNPGASLIGSIDFLPSDSSLGVGLDAWPPEREAFEQEPTLNDVTLFEERLLLPPLKLVSADTSLVSQTVDYEEIRCDWVTPRKASTWPARTHLGRIYSENNKPSLLIRLHELSAKDGRVDYKNGVIGRLGNSFRRREHSNSPASSPTPFDENRRVERLQGYKSQ